ncbi:hypothetical protein F5Y04DRAFT_266663 [Hypomontagnella monticulosa]|nr:hypothetical protein F5Y04DRAFT_266663 [Hypomontagnella monticulosa]
MSVISTLSRGFRVATGVGSLITAIMFISLRTLNNVSRTDWVIAYVIWGLCFLVFFWLQLQLVPGRLSHRKKLYIFSVIMATIHFCIAISQNTESILDGFTTFGPFILTACSYLMSLLFVGYSAGEGIPIELAAI